MIIHNLERRTSEVRKKEKEEKFRMFARRKVRREVRGEVRLG